MKYILAVTIVFVFITISFVKGFSQLSCAARHNVWQHRRCSSLFAKPTTNTGKVRVKLLTDVKGQGKKGEIIFVSSAMWSNVLSPSKQAQRMSDDELQRQIQAESEAEEKKFKYASDLADKMKDLTIPISKKVGNTGQLFGSVDKKHILESLKSKLSFEQDKSVVITSVKSGDEEVEEIRRAGKFKVFIKLHPKITGSFEVEIVKEAS